jgi:Family of unknown function (DUF6223)
MNKEGRARFLSAIFIVLVAIPTFTVLRPIGISGQTVQQKQDAVQLAAHVWVQPAPTRVYGFTPRRLWATTATLLALAGVVIGGLALRRSAGRIGAGNARTGPIMALVVGLIAVVNGVLNLAVATGGLGTGNGVVGGAVALVLGLIAIALGGLALARTRGAG